MSLRPRQAPVAIAFVVSLFHPAPCPILDADEIDAPASPRRPQGRVVRDSEILPGIYLIDGIDASMPTYDLRALGDLIGDAQVVALGESIHTSGGYYRAKHRVFRYLVEELGFRAFAFESPWYEAERVREYVDTCEGNSSFVVARGLFGVWAAQSVRELVEWMCHFNQAHPDDPVAFWGFDIQQPWDDGRLLVDYLERVLLDPMTFSEGIELCNGVGYQSSYRYHSDPNSHVVTEEDHATCLDALARLEQYFEDNEDSLVANTSAEALAWARINLVGIRSWENARYHHFRGDHAMGMQSRDEGMARVFRSIKALRNPNEPVAIWAHNWHIAYRTQDIPSFGGARSMGSFLQDDLDHQYFVLGLVGYEVWINWAYNYVGMLPLPPSPEHAEYRLHHEINRDYLLVDLSFPGTDEPFFEDEAWYFLNGSRLVPGEHFNALLYLDVSPMMRSLGR